MKISKTLLLLASLLIIAMPVMSQDYSNAGGYMQYFSEQSTQVSKDTWDYMSAISRGKNARKVEVRRKELLKTILNSKRKIAVVKPFKEDQALRDSMVSYLQLTYNVLHEDYDKILDLEEIAEQSYDQMETYMKIRKQAGQKLSDAFDALNLEEKRFAVAHNVNLIEDQSKLGKKLERAGNAFDYYDEIYLVFFKSQIQELHMVDALNKSDMNAAEQCKNSLRQFSEEGLVSLKEYQSYQGDATLIVACKNLFNFYKKESEVKAPIMIDFYLKKDNFDKIAAAMKSKGKSPTKEEIDNYNKSQKEFNSVVNSYNIINNEVNKERSEKQNAWQNAVKNFLDKHAS